VSSSYFSPLRTAWRQPAFRRECAATVAVAAAVILSLTRFLEGVERRPGAVLSDPLLALFPAVDLTWITFLIIYAGLIGAIALLLRHPRHFLWALQTYSLTAVVRIVAMWLMPLDPPAGMIALKDPIVEFFGGGNTLTRDLFFSGHTSTLLIIALTLPGRRARVLFFAATAAVGICVILQHVHYSIDVFAAVFFAYGCHRITGGLRERFVRNEETGERG
jgi:membrane-associated phospholipid phosphatase